MGSAADQLQNGVIYNLVVSRKLILALAVGAILMVMAGALIYEGFDVHDPKPFLIDPEFLVYMLGAVLVLCLGTVLLTVGLLNFYLLLSELLPFRLSNLAPSLWHQYEAFEVEHILFSPPLEAISLRI
jgi:hypothetical protein